MTDAWMRVMIFESENPGYDNSEYWERDNEKKRTELESLAAACVKKETDEESKSYMKDWHESYWGIGHW